MKGKISSLIQSDKPISVEHGVMRIFYTPAHANRKTGFYRLVLGQSKRFPDAKYKKEFEAAIRKLLKERSRYAASFTIDLFKKLEHPKWGELGCVIIEWAEYEGQKPLFVAPPPAVRANPYEGGNA